MSATLRIVLNPLRYLLLNPFQKQSDLEQKLKETKIPIGTFLKPLRSLRFLLFNPLLHTARFQTEDDKGKEDFNRIISGDSWFPSVNPQETKGTEKGSSTDFEQKITKETKVLIGRFLERLRYLRCLLLSPFRSENLRFLLFDLSVTAIPGFQQKITKETKICSDNSEKPSLPSLPSVMRCISFKYASCVFLLSLFVLSTAPAQTPIQGTFTRTTDMTSPRERHTATLLDNGKVLVAGGNTQTGSPTLPTSAINTAELFDPTASPPTFTSLPSMNVIRSDHTATLLLDGRVLVAGGVSTAGGNTNMVVVVTNTAELFDPAAETFTSTGLMTQQRAGHTATLLPDGRVLIAGGDTGSVGGTATTIDPTSGIFTPNTGHGLQYYHRPTGNTEQFDPQTGLFTALPAMNVARAGHTATLVTVAGKNQLLIAGGVTDGSGSITNTAELFDPESGTFTLLPLGMIVPRAGHTATLLENGKVLIAGGITAEGVATNTAELFDPTFGIFTPVGPMTLPRFAHTAALLPGGTVFVAGGDITGSGQPTDTAETFDPLLEIFLPLLKPPLLEPNNMTIPRYYHRPTSVVMVPYGLGLGGPSVLITGGITQVQVEGQFVPQVTNTAEVFTTTGGGTACPEARHGHAMAVNPVRNTALLFGGAHGSRLLSDTWEWNGTAWSQINSAGPTVRPGLAMAEGSASGINLLVGTNVFSGAFETWEFDGATAVWTKVFTSSSSTDPQVRPSYALALDSTRNVVVYFGGGDLTLPQDTPAVDTYEWNPTTKTWNGPFAGATVRTGHAMGFATWGAHSGVVLYGPEGWRWDGTSWQPDLQGNNPPSQSVGLAMASRPAHDEVLMVGGAAPLGWTGDEGWTWGWQPGMGWFPEGAGPPGPYPFTDNIHDRLTRHHHAMSADLSTERGIVLFGGLDADGQDLGDTWTWGARGSWWVHIPTCVPEVALISVISRKAHGSAGTFDIDLPLDGTGIECRSGGASGDYTIIFSFANALTSVGSASVPNGTGSVNSSAAGADAHQYIVNLTGVTNAQTIIVSLTNVTDSVGNFSPAVSASMGVLLGDTTGNGSVNSSDISQTKAQSGTTADANNFRTDVTVNGLVNSSDISTVKSKSGTALP